MKEKFSVFSWKHAESAVARSSSGRAFHAVSLQLRTIWSLISFIWTARRITQMQQNEGASDQAVQSLKSTCVYEKQVDILSMSPGLGDILMKFCNAR